MTFDLVAPLLYRYPPCVPGGTIMDVRFPLIPSSQQNKPTDYCAETQTETLQQVA